MGPSAGMDETAARIVDAAAACFKERGVRRTTMTRIASTAGIGVATAYRRFPQKAQLIRTVILTEASAVATAVAREMERPVGVAEQSAGGFTAFAHALADRQWLVDLLRGSGPDAGVVEAPGALIDQVMSLARDHVADWLRGYQAQGRFVGLDPEIVGEIYARLALSLVLAPDGAIPMHEDEATRGFARKYLVPLLGDEARLPVRSGQE